MVEVEIFADEIILNNDILGVCCLFIPLNFKNELVSNLLNMRCLSHSNSKWYPEFESCPNKDNCKKELHSLNDCEIHNKNIRNARASGALKSISKNWLHYFVNQNKIDNAIRFNILYIQLNKMDISNFGKSKVHENMYNRFFRTTINYGLKSFFNSSKVIVKNVYHDTGNMENHSYFPYLNLYRLENEISDVAQFQNKEVVFVDSNHKIYLQGGKSYYNESQIIQFTDLILGNISQCLFDLSNDTLKKEYASILYPLVKKLIEDPKDKNSSWHYVNKQNISFFPKSSGKEFKTKCLDLNGNLRDDIKNEFHKDVSLKMSFFDQKQRKLTDFC